MLRCKLLKSKRFYSVARKNVRVLYVNDLLPKVVRKTITPILYPKLKLEPDKEGAEKPDVQQKELRVNELNMQMLSKNIYEQIFRATSESRPTDDKVDSCIQELNNHGLRVEDAKYLQEVMLKLPPLKGENLEEHYRIIGEQQVGPYRTLLLELLRGIPEMPKTWLQIPGWVRYVPGCEPEVVSHPLEDAVVFDVEIALKAGRIPTLATAVSNKAWYAWVSQSLLDESNRPITNQHYLLDDLIPMEAKSKSYNFGPELRKPRIVVGHNVSFDRSRIREQYYFEKTGTRFVDTMSFHICVSGITSFQRALLKSAKEVDNDEKWRTNSSLNSLSEVHKLYCGKEIDKATRDIFLEGSLTEIKNDFDNVMKYCANDVLATYNVLKVLFPMFLERFSHPVTLAGMLELGLAYLPVNENWNHYISECEQTYEDLNSEGKYLLARRADQACRLMHDERYKDDLWMWDQDWSTQELKLKKTATTRIVSSTVKKTRKKNESSDTEDEYKRKLKRILKKNKPDQNITSELTVKNHQNELGENEEDIDPLEQKFQPLLDIMTFLPVRMPHLPGYPAWYRKLCTKPSMDENWIPGPHLISTSMQVTPKLLNLTWEGYPLHFIREKGWGFLVPHTNDTVNKTFPIHRLIEKCPILNLKPDEAKYPQESFQKDVEKDLTRREWWNSKAKKDKTDGTYKGTGVWCNYNLENCCWFMKLPHKDGVSNNVGNPLARDFLNKFSENVLAGDSDSAEKVLSISRMLSYWRNNRDRIMQQMVVWLKQSEVPKTMRQFQFGAILPQVVVCGTLTRRAMEPTWMTASNAHKERVGSELRSMVQAPPGYSIVGADVDSQELWIASVLGDADYAKMHGASPLGWMTLIGTKSEGTDMHSVTAKVVGISRDHAKVINYARIYGAGQNFAERLLKQFNPSMTESAAKTKARKMFSITKGRRIFRLRPEYTSDLENKPYSIYQAFEISKAMGKTVNEVFLHPKWFGGSESAMFNRLEEIAAKPNPVTPFLEGRLSRALEPENMPSDDRFLPTRVNWVVQSGAVDFLHLMLVTMRWLMKDKIRFCLSFHDEVRYLVPNELKYDAALAMHITNLLTRSFCSMKLGINDLPMSVAFFSSVEVDTVLRKESHLDCKTPSNPHGLEKGYRIKNGESLNIHNCIEKTGGEISLWKEKKKKRFAVLPY